MTTVSGRSIAARVALLVLLTVALGGCWRSFTLPGGGDDGNPPPDGGRMDAGPPDPGSRDAGPRGDGGSLDGGGLRGDGGLDAAVGMDRDGGVDAGPDAGPPCRFSRPRGPIGGVVTCPAPLLLDPGGDLLYRGSCEGLQVISLPPDVLYFWRDAVEIPAPSDFAVSGNRLYAASTEEEPFLTVLTRASASEAPRALGTWEESTLDRIDVLGDRLVGVASPRADQGFLFLLDVGTDTPARVDDVTLPTRLADVAFLDEETVWVLVRSVGEDPPALAVFGLDDDTLVERGRVDLDREFEELVFSEGVALAAGVDAVEAFEEGLDGLPVSIGRLDLAGEEVFTVQGRGTEALVGLRNALSLRDLASPFPAVRAPRLRLPGVVRSSRLGDRVALSAGLGAYIVEIECGFDGDAGAP